MAYKKKTRTETVPMPQPSTVDLGDGPDTTAATEVRVMESGEFEMQMAKYARDMSSIPAMLGDILKELVAIRLIKEKEK